MLVDHIKIALDELRMQMLGLQVLIGFQLQSLFQPGFGSVPVPLRAFDALGLFSLLVTLTILIGIPCQHRIVERGESTTRLFASAKRAANIALLPLAVGIGCDILVATSAVFGLAIAGWSSISATAAALGAWYWLARHLRRHIATAEQKPMQDSRTPLHAKIDQMLTEARVILPGSQALLGFQLAVLLTPSFAQLPEATRYVHLAALLFVLVSIILLICPAAVHRMAFAGMDQPRMHAVGSVLITIALLPLAGSLALDIDVALVKLFSHQALAAGCAAAALLLMGTFWYALPFAIRRRATD